MKFPIIQGRNLNFQKQEIPNDLGGELNLIIIPFKRWQQDSVDSWVPSLNRFQEFFPKFRFYEVPILNKKWIIEKNYIDGGMRQGIPNNSTRERTITVYLDKNVFKNQLDISSESKIKLFLVSSNHEIIWQNEGPNSAEAENSLTSFLQKYFN